MPVQQFPANGYSAFIETVSINAWTRWCKAKLGWGWVWGKEYSLTDKTDPSLRPWSELTNEEKHRARESVRMVVGGMEDIGLTFRFGEPEEEQE